VTPEQWRLVTELFHGALAHAADEHPKYLDAACYNASLRAEVEALLLTQAEVSGARKRRRL
jgi:hypothetical protein